MTEQSIDGDKAANQGGSFFKIMVSKLDLGTLGPLIALGLLLVFGAMLNPTFVSIDIREVYRPIYFEGILGVGWPVIVFLLMAVLGEFIMRRTVFGLGVICPGNISASACRSWEHGCLGK